MYCSCFAAGADFAAAEIPIVAQLIVSHPLPTIHRATFCMPNGL
jgi:hypothetical protein